MTHDLDKAHEANVLDFLRHEVFDLMRLPEMAKRGLVADGEWTDAGQEWLDAEMDRPGGLKGLRELIASASPP